MVQSVRNLTATPHDQRNLAHISDVHSNIIVTHIYRKCFFESSQRFEYGSEIQRFEYSFQIRIYFSNIHNSNFDGSPTCYFSVFPFTLINMMVRILKIKYSLYYYKNSIVLCFFFNSLKGVNEKFPLLCHSQQDRLVLCHEVWFNQPN